MQLKNLELTNYRNYAKEQFEFKPGLNVIVGSNAQGKTNMLEAIYFCAVAKSMRLNKEKELIKFGENFAKIDLRANGKLGNVRVQIRLNSEGKKNIKINEMTVLKVGELLGVVPAVYFSPDELKLVKESPDHRRRFLDISISVTNKSYFYSLIRYEKIINQRNKLLKTAKSLDEISPSLDIFTTQLIKEAAKIIFERCRFIKQFKNPLKNAHSFLTNNKENISIQYNGQDGDNISEIELKLKKEFLKNRQKEFMQRHTLIGPHRDDFKIFINNKDVRHFGSQGQQRTATLSLKLAELELMKQRFDEYPILLLDDVLSELDDERKNKLLEVCSTTQVILTCTSFEKIKHSNANIIKIFNGKIC